MTIEFKPNKGLMAVHMDLNLIKEKIETIDEKIELYDEELKYHASQSDIVQWTMVNEKKKTSISERAFLRDQEKAYHKAIGKRSEEEELERKQERSASMKKLFSENYKLRKDLQTIINSLINKFKAIESLHVKRIAEVPDVSEPERQAFNQDNFFHDFFMVLSSHPEALRFLQVAKKMEYRQMPKIRKMKDYQYEETSDTAH